WADSFVKRDKALRLFEICLSVWVIFHAFKIYSIRGLLTSEYGFCSPYSGVYPLGLSPDLLSPLIKKYFYPLILVQVGIAASIIFRPSNMVARLVLWSSSVCMLTACDSIIDGGTILLRIILFLYIFCDAKGIEKSRSDPYQKWLFCLLVLSMQMQIVFVYIQASISKIRADAWVDGVAMYYILQIPEYANQAITQYLLEHDWILVSVAYGTIFFQALFAFAMTSRILRPFWLAVGVCLHLAIAFTMGLFTFGMLMIIFYILFLSNRDVEKIVMFLKPKNSMWPKLKPLIKV
ncbi:MAG: HTTM domain-containing protein, partial [Myxococcales bacterium]|nr:HTTM domain-containing protein [Myxococcales bacterium]